MSDHFLIKFEATRACRHNVCADVFTTHHVGPLTLAAFGERLHVVLSPFTAATGPVENCTSDLNSTLSYRLDSIESFYQNKLVKEVYVQMA